MFCFCVAQAAKVSPGEGATTNGVSWNGRTGLVPLPELGPRALSELTRGGPTSCSQESLHANVGGKGSVQAVMKPAEAQKSSKESRGWEEGADLNQSSGTAVAWEGKGPLGAQAKPLLPWSSYPSIWAIIFTPVVPMYR